MDPNATLAELRQMYQSPHLSFDPERMADLVQALDEWLSNGGFLPRTWTVNR